MKRIWIWLAVAGIAVVLVTAVVVPSLRAEKRQSTPPKRSSIPLDARKIQLVADDLHSGDADKFRAALELPEGVNISPEAVRGVHELQAVTLDPASLHDNGDDTAEAVFSIVDAAGIRSAWQVTLAVSDGNWVITSTTKG